MSSFETFDTTISTLTPTLSFSRKRKRVSLTNTISIYSNAESTPEVFVYEPEKLKLSSFNVNGNSYWLQQNDDVSAKTSIGVTNDANLRNETGEPKSGIEFGVQNGVSFIRTFDNSAISIQSSVNLPPFYQDLVPATDLTYSLGSNSNRWNECFTNILNSTFVKTLIPYESSTTCGSSSKPFISIFGNQGFFDNIQPILGNDLVCNANLLTSTYTIGKSAALIPQIFVNETLTSNLNCNGSGISLKTNIVPDVTLSRNLGSVTNRFNTLYVNSIDWLGTLSVNQNIIPSVNDTYTLGNSSFRYNTVFTNNLNANGTLTFACNMIPDGNNTRNIGSNPNFLNTVFTNNIQASTNLTINAVAIPNADNTRDLGSTTRRFATIYGVNLGSSAYRFTQVFTDGITASTNLTITGNILPDANLTRSIGTTSFRYSTVFTDNITSTSNLTIAANILPNGNNVRDFGATGMRFKDGWFSGTVTATTLSGACSGTTGTFTTSVTTPLVTTTGILTLTSSTTARIAFSGNVEPNADNTRAIGTSALRFTNVFATGLNSGASNLTITSNALVTISGNIVPNANATRDIGSTTLRYANIFANLISATTNLTISNTVVPDADNTRSLGSSSVRYNTVFANILSAATSLTTQTDIVPSANNTLSLGTTATRFNSVNATTVNCSTVGSANGDTTIQLGTNPTNGIFISGNTNIISASSGGNAGVHLVITINGTQYKIALQNP